MAKNDQTVSPHTAGARTGCLLPAPGLCPVNRDTKAWDYQTEVPFPLDALLFFLQVKDHGENTYYSNFIAHLNNIRYPGEESPQRRQELVAEQGAWKGDISREGGHTGPAGGPGLSCQRLLLSAQAANTLEKPVHTPHVLIPTVGSQGTTDRGYLRFTSSSSE